MLFRSVVDFDVGLRNLDLIMGCERRVVYDLLNVIHGEGSLNQALIKDKREDKFFVLPASQTRNKDALSFEGVRNVIAELQERFSVRKMTEFLRFKRGKEVLEYPKLPASFEGNAFLPQRAFIPIAFNSKKHPKTLVMKGETVKEGQITCFDDCCLFGWCDKYYEIGRASCRERV